MRHLLLLFALCWLQPAWAQDEPDDAELLARTQAESLLEQALPPLGAARLDLLERQGLAAQQLGQRGRQVALARQLVDEGRADARWPIWVRAYLNTEFIWGRPQQALDACEAWVVDAKLPPSLRALVALRQTYIRAAEGELLATRNEWARAERLLADSAKAAKQAPTHVFERFIAVDALQVRAELERLEGRLAAAPATLREALQLIERLRAAHPADAAHADAWADGSRGMLLYALVRQGRPGEALLMADEQLRRWQRGEVVGHRLLGEARWQYRRAHALNALQRHAPALAAADEALRRFAEAGVEASSHVGHLALSERVRALLGLRRWVEADAAYTQHIAAVAGDRVATARSNNPALRVVLAAQAGRLDEALAAAERSLRYRERLYGNEHPLTQEIAGARGFVRLARGDAPGALADFERLFAATLDQPGGWLDLEQRGNRGFLLGLVFDTLLRWVAQQPQPSSAVVERALQIADRLKLGSTQRALVDASSRVQARDPALRARLEAEQAARQRSSTAFEALQALLADEDAQRREMSAPAFKERAADERKAARDRLAALREQIALAQAQAKAARAALLAEREAIATQFPRYADLVSPPLPAAAQLARWLQPGEALLVVHSIEPATLVWLLRPGSAPAFRALPWPEAQLEAEVEAWRAALDLSARLQSPAPLAAVAGPAHALHERLLGPLRAELTGVRSLLVASNGALARVPLGALLRSPWQPGTPPAWLLRDMAVTQLPAAASLQALRRAPAEAAPSQALLGFGDPQFSAAASAPRKGARLLAPPPGARALRWDEQRGLRYGDIPPLPDTRTELQAIARQLGAGPDSLRLGAAATRRALLAAPLEQVRVLALATHGLLPGELPGLSQPALALAADGAEPPLLELEDVLGLRLRALWVLLSACNSAGAQQGDEAMSGLVRGFFFAGARSVLATHWAVESESAAALSAAVFAPGSPTRAEALRRAQLQLADGANAAWRHPYHWAGYALFGDPGN